MVRATKPNPERGARLLDLWSPPPEAGEPVGCVATTFTFDAGHFEEQCLGRFLLMESDPAESLKAYLIEREEKLSQSFACVLADQRNVTAQRSLRWHLLGVRLPGSAIQHAKLSILLWERHLRILIGSANLTDPGYRTNLEVVVPFNFSPDGGAPIDLARQCFEFLGDLASFTPGAVDQMGPRKALAEFLARARERILDWKESDSPTGVRCELIPLLPTGRSGSVIAQLRRVWQGAAPTDATVVSPFFDRSDDGVDRVYREFASLMTTRGERVINFASSGRETPNGPVQIDIPARLINSPLRHPSMTHGVGYVTERQKVEDGDALRSLHTKALFLERDENAVVVFGSSNFTLAGFGLIPAHNAELNVAYRVPPAEGKFFRQCDEALPPISWLEEDAKRELIQGLEFSEDTGSPVALLPRGFLEALYRPEEKGGSLELWLEPADLPQRFTVFLPAGVTLLDVEDWRTTFGAASRVLVPLAEVASGLTVKWQGDAGEALSAVWPINVSDVSLLVPPKELRDLALEDLILVLTSARPPFRVLADRAEANARAGSPPAAVDPHKKVDTSRFLLKRMRRLAKALEGLRVRLERPVASLEGWRWRLQGPLGPVALARAIKAESGHEASFFVSEIATTLKTVRWVAGVGIAPTVVRQELEIAIRLLRDLSLEHVNDMPANLSAYVREVFPETAA